MAEMDREGPLGHAQRRQPGEKGRHRIGLGAGHGGLRGAVGAVDVAGQRQHQRPGAGGGRIPHQQLLLEQPQGPLALAADAERQG
jgi:hypothetical protein